MKNHYRKIKAKQRRKSVQIVFKDIEKEVNKAFNKEDPISLGKQKVKAPKANMNRRKSKEIVEYKLPQLKKMRHKRPKSISKLDQRFPLQQIVEESVEETIIMRQKQSKHQVILKP